MITNLSNTKYGETAGQRLPYIATRAHSVSWLIGEGPVNMLTLPGTKLSHLSLPCCHENYQVVKV